MLAVIASDRSKIGGEEVSDLVSSYLSLKGGNKENIEGGVYVTEYGIMQGFIVDMVVITHRVSDRSKLGGCSLGKAQR